ncbi:hypothetical protein EGR_10739 [Echinococcus granulosus]|uniref:Uncharacterized protein n=1 Tax=Echinococcus granulosus TaxID=6210 RepID=W6U1I1_ECHGR|nr:hypothetical protein EGR_10739 [Echinococcus granulosus]EUB54396.1 hypothetical protein EGR_10739 [Echinococcus granulosus]
MIDARCAVTTTSKVAIFDLATLALKDLSTHGVECITSSLAVFCVTFARQCLLCMEKTV